MDATLWRARTLWRIERAFFGNRMDRLRWILETEQVDTDSGKLRRAEVLVVATEQDNGAMVMEPVHQEILMQQTTLILSTIMLVK